MNKYGCVFSECGAFNEHAAHTWRVGFLWLTKRHCRGLEVAGYSDNPWTRANPSIGIRVKPEVFEVMHKCRFALTGMSEYGFSLIWKCQDCLAHWDQDRALFYLEMLGWRTHKNFCGVWELHGTHIMRYSNYAYAYDCKGLSFEDLKHIQKATVSA